MTVAELFEELSQRSVDVYLDDGKLRLDAPRGALTPELLDRIRACRDEMIAVLESAHQAPELEPIPTRPPSEPAALTPAQRALWFSSQLIGNTTVLNVPLALKLHGPLDVDALGRAVTELGRRHDALTSHIELVGDTPHQLHRGAELGLSVEDYSGLGPIERERVVFARRAEEASRPIALEFGPLARCCLFKLSDSEHVLVFVASRLVFDDASTQLFIGELSSLYEHYAHGTPAPAPPACRFADFARYKAKAGRRSCDADIAYFRDKLAGVPGHIELPLDRPRPQRQSHTSVKCFAWLEPELVERLRQLARANNATLSMVTLACVELLVARYSGQADFVIGVLADGRERAECEGVIGMFVNPLALRSEVRHGGTFRELLGRVRERQLEALLHRDAPLEALHGLLGRGREPQRSSLFQVLFSFQEAGERSLRMGQVTVEALPSFSGSLLTELSFSLRDHGGGVFLALEAEADLFDAETIGRWFRSLTHLLRVVTENPDAPLERLPAIAPEDESFLLDELNDTKTPWDDGALIHRLFEREVDRRPDAVALVSEERSLTYSELDARANRLAHRLVALGVGPGTLVGIYLPRRPELVVAMLAVLKAGGAYVALDGDAPLERVQAVLHDFAAAVLISSSTLARRLAAPSTRVLIDRDFGHIAAEPSARLARPERSDQLACVLYPPSSGALRGVMVEHRNVTSLFVGLESAIRLDASGVWLSNASPSSPLSALELLATLCHGARVVLLAQPVLDNGRSPRRSLPALMARHGVTHFQCTASQARSLTLEESGRRALASLEQLIVAGEALPQDLADELTLLVSGEVVNVYGSPETMGCATVSAPLEHGKSVSIGKPLANGSLFVLDERGAPVPFGAVGEIFVGGPFLARGYFERPELTRERFVPNLLRPELGPRLFRTGALVRYAPDGSLLFIGEHWRPVTISGRRLELAEIERTIRAREGVDDAVVSPIGEGDEARLVGYLVTNPKYDGDEALIASLRQHLPKFMVPTGFVRLSALPLDADGKLDRCALPTPGSSSLEPRAPVPPRDDLERQLCELWRDVLGVDSLGVTDDFFELGGHSLMALKLSDEVHREFGVRLPLAALFECSTIERLARRIAACAERSGVDPHARATTLVRLQPHGSRPPFFCVADVKGDPTNLRALARALGPEQPFFGLKYPGADGKLTPHRRIEDLAREFLADVRRVYPEGPYYLGGWSAGGLVAYEMARLLCQAGERVALCVLFDTQSPALETWSLRDRLDAHLQNLRRRGFSYLSARALARTREELARRSRALRAKLAPYYPGAFHRDAVWAAMEEAIREYRPEPAPFDVLLVRADPTLSTGGGIGQKPHGSNGFRDLVQGELEIVELACDHAELVRAHGAELTARALERALANASLKSLCSSATRRAELKSRPTIKKRVLLTG